MRSYPESTSAFWLNLYNVFGRREQQSEDVEE